MVDRLYFTAEEISIALRNAGIELRPEDCLVTKFYQVAEELGKKARSHVRRELEKFADSIGK